MSRVDVMFTDKASGGSWVVLLQDGPKAKATYFKGEDAQRLAYEYAAGVLGKKGDGKPAEPSTRDRVIQRLTSSIMYGLTSTTPPYAGQTSEFVTGLIDSLSPPSPWISVKERMPKGGGPVLVYMATVYGTKVQLVAEYGALKYDHLGWRLPETTTGCGASWGTVTHWMPLPEPPKEDR